jgi:hypothetical protein
MRSDTMTVRHSNMRKLADLPPGWIIDGAWLAANGISRQSASAYVASGWLDRVAAGLYRRGGHRPVAADWLIAVASIQALLGHRCHVGGATAISLRGMAHYIRMRGPEPVYLYGDAPSWVDRLPSDGVFHRRPPSLFSDRYSALSAISTDGISITVSLPERAMMEAIDELRPGLDGAAFDTADKAMESLVTMRPRVVTALLESCRSIKTKRIFCVLAKRHAHPWWKHVDMSSVDMGRGDRAFVKGGSMHPDYRITVPSEIATQSGQEGR